MLTIINKNESSETRYICPSCGKEGSFISIAAPISCDYCNVLLPDILEMKFDEYERKKYHIGGACY